MTVKERITALREVMAEKKIDAYLVPTDDFHASEYVGEFTPASESHTERLTVPLYLFSLDKAHLFNTSKFLNVIYFVSIE